MADYKDIVGSTVRSNDGVLTSAKTGELLQGRIDLFNVVDESAPYSNVILSPDRSKFLISIR